MAKHTYRGAGKRIFLLILAAAIIVGTVLACYCASVDGEWAKNPNPSTWRWGGIWTEEETPGAALGGMHTVSNELEGGHHAAPLAAGGGGGLGSLKGCFSCGDATATLTIKSYTAATCTTAGERSTVCNSCGNIQKSTYSALGHNYKWTYTTTTDTYSCTRCNDVSETRAHTHAYAWTVTLEPTQEAEGEESYKCSTCGDVQETRVLPKLATPVELPPDPVKEGYTFTGWFFDEACTQPYDGRVIYEDTVLYAGWQINTFTVTFDSAGGSDVPAQTVDWNTAATLTTPERLGYKFLGWYLSDDVQYEGAGITENVTLTAHWERCKCTVSFYVDGVLYTSLTVDYGTPLIQAAEAVGLLEQNILSYSFIDGSEPAGAVSEQTVTGDMSINAGEPTREDKIKGAVKSYWLPATSCALGAVAAVLILWAVFSGRRKKR